MTTNMGVVKVIVKEVPSHCGYCEFGFDTGWLDSPPKNTCILMNKPIHDIVNNVARPNWCPLVKEDA
jgi:hypothetical protein